MMKTSEVIRMCRSLAASMAALACPELKSDAGPPLISAERKPL
jgi:hypothetical protein